MVILPGEIREFLPLWRDSAPEVYQGRIGAYLDHVQARNEEVSPRTLVGYLDELSGSGMSPSTIRGAFFAVKKVILAYHEYRGSSESAATTEVERYSIALQLQGVRLPKVVPGKRALMVKGFRPEVIDRVVRHTTQRRAAMIEFLVDTGLRVSEMSGLRLRAIRPYSRTFSFVSVVGKGGKERVIWIRNALVTRIRRVFKGKVWLFETKNGTAFDRRNVWFLVKKAFGDVAGISLSPHNLRHIHAMKMLRKASPAQVARALGHSTPATTGLFYDSDTIPAELYEEKHHGARGSKGGNPYGRNRKPPNV